MFNWYTAPTFAATLLFWLLAAYVLTRGRRDAIAVAAVIALESAAAYLLGEAMEANATTPEQWRTWALGLRWGATVTAAAWYWLTVLLLREQGTPTTRRYLRRVGYPLGIVVAAGGIIFAGALYAGDWLWVLSAPVLPEPPDDPYRRYLALPGPLYAAFTTYVVLVALATAANLVLAWRALARTQQRRRFVWLLLSLVLFIPEVGSLAAYHWLGVAVPTWINHLCIAAAIALMAANVAEYHHLRHGRTIKADLLYDLTGWLLAAVAFVPVLALAGVGYSFDVLGLLVVTVAFAVHAHALAEPVRRLLDRAFFVREVQRLRSSLSEMVQDAAITPDEQLGALLGQAQAELADVSAEHLTRLTQEALRRLNAPAGLAGCGLAERLPRTIAAIRRTSAAAAGPGPTGDAALGAPTPIEAARALRTAVVDAVERLKPDDPRDPGAPAALQYFVLHEAYVLGRPTRQVMTRRGISESTFHRNRREAVSLLARELGRQEERLAARQDGHPRAANGA